MLTKASPEAIIFFEYEQVPLAVTLVQFDFEHEPVLERVYVAEHVVHVVADEQTAHPDGQAVQFGAT